MTVPGAHRSALPASPARSTSASAKTDVCLVNMPYASLPRASLALGLLKAVLAADGIGTVTVYANLWFADLVGISRYHLCSHQSPTEFLAGEWTFAEAAFPDARCRDDEYLARVGAAWPRVYTHGRAGSAELLIGELRALRTAATAFIDLAAARVLATGARIVGCTSTFEQHVASLALLRRIRALDPSVVTMIGGANCETVMGETTHRQFPWIDFVVSGEADGLIAALCRRIRDDGRDLPLEALPAGVLGPAHRRARTRPRSGSAAEHRVPAVPRAMFRNLDDLPIPDLDDYFAELAAARTGVNIAPGLPLETSRGCWWGAVHHCTFCGLNGSSMTYRSKSPDRVLDEIRTLEARHAISRFEVVDNILDAGYLRTLLPRLADDETRRSLFYEVKANLSRAQVAALRGAGVTWVQPGIESLHTGVLKLMDKGVHGWQNLQLLKWAREFGLRLSWSVLWGFPGEEDEWYRDMARWVPQLEHLQPAAGLIRLRYDRYSVYHQRPDAYGLTLEPISAMRYVYPLSAGELGDLAYFFTTRDAPDVFRDEGPVDVLRQRPGVAGLLRRLHRWKKAFARDVPPVLTLDDDGETLDLIDTRGCAAELRTRLRSLERAIVLACDQAPRADRLDAVLAKDFGLAPAEDALRAAVADLMRRHVLLEIDQRLVTLAIRGSLPSLPGRDEFPGGFVTEAPLRAGALTGVRV